MIEALLFGLILGAVGIGSRSKDENEGSESGSTSRTFTETGFDPDRQVRWERHTRYDIEND